METQGNESVGTEVVESVSTGVEPSAEGDSSEQVDDTLRERQTEVEKPAENQTLQDKLLAKAASKKAKDTTGQTQATQAAGAKQYTANTKFKVLDKEYEFEDWAKGVVKDAETEKKVRELHEKAYGLDSVKGDRQTVKAQLQETTAQLQDVHTKINALHEVKNKKDYDTFFEAWQIPKEDIIRYALDVIKREEDPNAKAQWENNRRAIYEQQAFQQQQQQLTQSQREFAVQRRGFELDGAMSKPDIAQIAQAFDTGTGRPGAFRDYVIKLGAAAFATDGTDLPAEQAIQMAVSHLRAVNPTLGQTNGATQNEKVVSPNTKPSIPNIRGSGSSPIRAKVKSLDDIRNRSREMDRQA